MKYIVEEIQTFEVGSIATPAYSYDNRAAAERQFHLLVAGAVVSELPTHAVILMTNDGRLLEAKSYTHQKEEVSTEEPS